MNTATASKFARSKFAEAQSAVHEATAPKAKRAPRKVTPEPEQVFGTYEAEVNRLTGARVLTAIVFSWCAYCASFYGTMSLVNIAVLAAAAYTGVGFITFMVWALGAVLAIVGGIKIAAATFKFVVDFDLNTVVESAQYTKAKVLGYFRSAR